MTIYATTKSAKDSKDVFEAADQAPASNWHELTLESIRVTISELDCDLDLDPVGSQILKELDNDVQKFEKNFGNDPLGSLHLMNLNTRVAALKKYSKTVSYDDSALIMPIHA